MAVSQKQLTFLETADFLKVIQQYSDESGKDFSDAINLKMRDACMKAAMRAPVASRVDIVRKLVPKVIAERLSKKPAQMVVRRSVRNMPGGTQRVYYRKGMRHYSREDALLYWQAVLNRRIRSINFIKSFFVALAMKIEDSCPELPPAVNAKYKPSHRLNYAKATPGSPNAIGMADYAYLKAKGGATVDLILDRAWNVGLGLTLLDAQQYIARKMRERADSHSVK